MVDEKKEVQVESFSQKQEENTLFKMPTERGKGDILSVLGNRKKANELKTAIVKLPSGGVAYPKEWGFSDGVKVREFLTVDRKSGVFDDLIERCVIQSDENERFRVGDLFSLDKDVLLLKMRQLTFGDVYEQELKCSGCSTEFFCSWNLNDIEISYLDVDSYPLKFVLPESGIEIGLRLLSDADHDEVKTELSRQARKNKTFDMSKEHEVYMICQAITTIDGKRYDDLGMKLQFFTSLSVTDSAFITFVIDSLRIGANLTKEAKCPVCGRTTWTRLLFTDSFFRPKFELPKGIGVKTIKNS